MAIIRYGSKSLNIIKMSVQLKFSLSFSLSLLSAAVFISHISHFALFPFIAREARKDHLWTRCDIQDSILLLVSFFSSNATL